MPFHHKDPFDRLLVAQAQVEEIPIVSDDLALDDYGVARLWWAQTQGRLFRFSDFELRALAVTTWQSPQLERG